MNGTDTAKLLLGAFAFMGVLAAICMHGDANAQRRGGVNVQPAVKVTRQPYHPPTEPIGDAYPAMLAAKPNAGNEVLVDIALPFGVSVRRHLKDSSFVCDKDTTPTGKAAREALEKLIEAEGRQGGIYVQDGPDCCCPYESPERSKFWIRKKSWKIGESEWINVAAWMIRHGYGKDGPPTQIQVGGDWIQHYAVFDKPTKTEGPPK